LDRAGTARRDFHDVAILSSGSPGVPQFDLVRRGYDREQVEVHLRELGDRLGASTQARQAAEQRIRTLEEELRATRARSENAEPAMSQESFGFRAEKILRLAEHEAADVRARAAKEAATVLEQARADAEKHRHEVEQTLIARSNELDKETTTRNVAIQEREQQAQATLADAREESQRITEEAQRSAEKTLADAQARAEQLQMRTDNECRRRREVAEQELRRLGELRDGVRSEITRLHGLLGAEVSGTPEGQPTRPPVVGSAPATAAGTPGANSGPGLPGQAAQKPAPSSTGPTPVASGIGSGLRGPGQAR
jgi:cell division septum initiation protein DivIVA